MNKTVAAAAAIALVVGLALGWVIGSVTGKQKLPQVRATNAGTETIEQLVGDMDAALSKLEEQIEQVKPQPRLEETVNNFNLVGAAAEGADNAKLTMVVFSDFECPFCRKFADTAKMIRTKYSNDLKLVFMNFPLDNGCNSAMSRPFHQRACMGAMAAAYAKENGKFWEMHDWLFENQGSYSVDSIVAHAQEMGLDPAKMKTAIETNQYRPQIEAEAMQLPPTGASGTPTAFINGRKVSNLRWDDLNAVMTFIDEQLNPKPKEEKKLEPTVKNAESLPAAQVVLPGGITLEDKLKDLRARLAGMELPVNKRGGGQQPQRRMPDPSKIYNFNLTGSPVQGPADAKATLVVFSDFLCPHCYRVAQVLADVRKQFPNDLRVVFKNVPAHQYSADAHEAAMEAFAQGKFWEMHDLLFANRLEFKPEKLPQLAQQAGLNMDQYKKAMEAHTHREELKRDLSEADTASVTGTPTMFLNGKLLQAGDPTALAAAINAALGRAPAPAPAAPPGQPGMPMAAPPSPAPIPAPGQQPAGH